MLAMLAGLSMPAEANHTINNKKNPGCPPGYTTAAGDKNGYPCHEPSPEPPSAPTDGSPVNICTVVGHVDIDNEWNTGGVGAQHDHNHFRFSSTVLDCQDPTGQGPPAGTFSVAAAGGTDGPTGPDAPPAAAAVHGETLDAGWSHGSCYSALCGVLGKISDLYAGVHVNAVTGNARNQGEITAAPGGVSTHNWLKFCRGEYLGDKGTGTGGLPVQNLGSDGLPKCFPSTGGGHVIAWGEVHFAPVTCFLADLRLVPQDEKLTDQKLDGAELIGTAVTWKASDHPCEGSKKAA